MFWGIFLAFFYFLEGARERMIPFRKLTKKERKNVIIKCISWVYYLKPSPKVKKKGNTTNKLIFHLMVTLSPHEIIIFPFFKDSPPIF